MNGRSFTFAIFVLIIGLAIFGLVSSVITNPMGVLRNIGYMLLVVGIFLLAIQDVYKFQWFRKFAKLI